MDIIYIHQYYRTPDQDGGTRSYEMARRLAAAGHHVTVITTDTDAPAGQHDWRVTRSGLVTVHYAPVAYDNTMGHRARLTAFQAFAAAAAQRARGLHRADVVLASSTPLTAAIPGVRAARHHRAPLVLEIRDVWPEVPIALGELPIGPARWAARALERWAYRNASQIVALSPDMARSIRRRTKTPITVIPNACDTDLFDDDVAGKELRAATPWLDDRPIVLYAGTLGRVNHTRYLVDLAYQCSGALGNGGIQVVLIGAGREHDAVRQHATDLGVLGQPGQDPNMDRNVFMLAPMPKREVAAWFSAADIVASTTMCIPELWANSANKVFDGWAAGRPVAVNTGGWIAEIIRDTGAGVAFNPNQRPEHSAAELRAFFADPDRVTAARYAARTLATDRFSRDHAATQLEEVLTTAVTEHRR